MTDRSAQLVAYLSEHLHDRAALAALRAVLDIHKPHQPYPQVPDMVWCAGCSKEGVIAVDYDHCPTVRAITDALEGKE